MREPLGNKVLVKDILEAENKTESGIIIPVGMSQSPLKKVEVLLVSKQIETIVKVGDTCLASREGVQIEEGVWLCNIDSLNAIL